MKIYMVSLLHRATINYDQRLFTTSIIWYWLLADILRGLALPVELVTHVVF